MHHPFRFHPTREDVLCVALRYAHAFGISTTELCRQYGLRRASLIKIDRGETMHRNRRLYYDILVEAINDRRLSYLARHKDELAQKAEKALLNVCLLNSRISPDELKIT